MHLGEIKCQTHNPVIFKKSNAPSSNICLGIIHLDCWGEARCTDDAHACTQFSKLQVAATLKCNTWNEACQPVTFGIYNHSGLHDLGNGTRRRQCAATAQVFSRLPLLLLYPGIINIFQPVSDCSLPISIHVLPHELQNTLYVPHVFNFRLKT